jgi:hypothetical protein
MVEDADVIRRRIQLRKLLMDMLTLFVFVIWFYISR